MRAARIENNTVVDLWEVPSLDVFGSTVPLIEAPEWVVLGASWDGAMFINPPQPPPPPPASITRRQLRLWLVRHGYTLAQVEALIDTLPEPQRTEARIEWEDAAQFERGHPLLRQIAGALLKTESEELDARLAEAFTEASSY